MIPTKSVPGGCLIGAFGVGCWVYAAFCLVVLIRFSDSSRPGKAELISDLRWHIAIAALAGLLSLFVGWRLAVRTGSYDHWDPKEPRMKF